MFSLCEGNTVIKPESDNSYFELSWLSHFLLNKQIESADESRGLVRAVMSRISALAVNYSPNRLIEARNIFIKFFEENNKKFKCIL